MTLREAKDAEARAFRLLQTCPTSLRRYRAERYAEARRARIVAEAQAALQPQQPTELERRVAEIEAKRGRAA
jgi:hypothetical protein